VAVGFHRGGPARSIGDGECRSAPGTLGSGRGAHHPAL